MAFGLLISLLILLCRETFKGNQAERERNAVIKFILSAAVVFLMISPLGYAKKLETVNPVTIERLRLNFKAAKTQFSTDLYKDWNCKLFGVRSKTFTLKKNKFFKFTKSQPDTLANQGAQVIKKYRVFPRGLWGQEKNLYENIRQLPDGRLITEISRPIKDAKSHLKSGSYASLAFAKHGVLAYGICQKNI